MKRAGQALWLALGALALILVLVGFYRIGTS
jgi:hypothetical protein